FKIAIGEETPDAGALHHVVVKAEARAAILEVNRFEDPAAVRNAGKQFLDARLHPIQLRRVLIEEEKEGRCHACKSEGLPTPRLDAADNTTGEHRANQRDPLGQEPYR